MSLALSLFGGAAFAQEGEAVSAVAQAATEQSEPAQPLRDDPFVLDGIEDAPAKVRLPGVSFRPAEVLPPKIPELHLIGIGRMRGGDSPTALIDVHGVGEFIVSVNDTISLQGLPGENVLRIVEINDISVTIEAGSLGELIVVR